MSESASISKSLDIQAAIEGITTALEELREAKDEEIELLRKLVQLKQQEMDRG